VYLILKKKQFIFYVESRDVISVRGFPELILTPGKQVFFHAGGVLRAAVNFKINPGHGADAKLVIQGVLYPSVFFLEQGDNPLGFRRRQNAYFYFCHHQLFVRYYLGYGNERSAEFKVPKQDVGKLVADKLADAERAVVHSREA